MIKKKRILIKIYNTRTSTQSVIVGSQSPSFINNGLEDLTDVVAVTPETGDTIVYHANTDTYNVEQLTINGGTF